MGGPDPSVAAARSAVRAALTSATPGTGLVVACSGGADSLALAVATAFVAPKLGIAATAVVVDHGMQTGSDHVAAQAAEQCRSLGLVTSVRTVQVAPDGSGPEAAARSARYAALEAARIDAGATAVLLGHTLDDQAESVLLALARGSGARSLAGMAQRRGTLVRPFLGLRRVDTEAVCRAAGLDFWVDPTNGPATPGDAIDGEPMEPDAPLPLRSQVRARVMPVLTDVLGRGAAPALARTADLLREDADLLDSLASDLLMQARAVVDTAPEGVTIDPGDIVLDVGVLAGAHPALRRRALRAAALAVGASAGDLFAVHIDALDALVTRWHGQGAVFLPGARSARRWCGRLFLRPPQPKE